MKLLNPLHRVSKFSYAALLGLVMASASVAQQNPTDTLLVTGQAMVVGGDTDSAMVRALLDALRTAATQREGQVTSHSLVNEEGQLTENISLQSNLNIRHMVVMEQTSVHGLATVKLALNLDERQNNCQAPQLTQVVTTDLSAPLNSASYHQVDINQLLLNTETQFSNLANSVNFVTHRINPTLNDYQTAWLASEAYNQADFHLAISAKWAANSSVSNVSNVFSALSGTKGYRPTLILSAEFSSPYLSHLNMAMQKKFTLPANRSIAASGEPIPSNLSLQVERWVKESWANLYGAIQCENSYIKLSKIIDQPLWRINKGKLLGLEQGQQLLLLPHNYQNGILNPDAVNAPHVFKVTQLQPHTALLEHIAGPKDITTATAQVIVF